jgi:hypothetical protein
MAVPRPILALILVFAAALIAFVAAATAPFHSPALAAKYQCPQGSTLRVQEYHASWTTPGETGISITCVDSEGVVRPSSDTETRGFWILTGIFFVPALAILLMMAWLITWLRGRPASR